MIKLEEFLNKINTDGYGNVYAEQKKKTYPLAFIDYFKGNKDTSLKLLQKLDPNNGTDGGCAGAVDFFWACSLNHQVKKWFLFKSEFTERYRDIFFRSAKQWTETDPWTRPHPDLGKKEVIGTNSIWGPALDGCCVDKRATDNLKLSVWTSVYLLAEETKNENTRLLYKDTLIKYKNRLSEVDLSEWDSVNYMADLVPSFLNLYDYATDGEIKDAAKYIIDWIFESAAIKYFNGHFIGASKRCSVLNYEKFGDNFSKFFGVAFEDIIDFSPHPYAIYLFTTSYKIPEEFLNLAKKDFSDIRSFIYRKPFYEHFKLQDDHPDVLNPHLIDTLICNKDFQVGTINHGDDNKKCNAPPDTKGFEIGIYNSIIGANKLVIGTDVNWISPHITKDPLDKLYQKDECVIWFRKGGGEYKLATNLRSLVWGDGYIFDGETTNVFVSPFNLTIAEFISESTCEKFSFNSTDTYSGFIVIISKNVENFSKVLAGTHLTVTYNNKSVSVNYDEI